MACAWAEHIGAPLKYRDYHYSLSKITMHRRGKLFAFSLLFLFAQKHKVQTGQVIPQMVMNST